jgi:hypothetical protein
MCIILMVLVRTQCTQKTKLGIPLFADNSVPMNNTLRKIKGKPPAVAHSTYGQCCVQNTMTVTLSILFFYV